MHVTGYPVRHWVFLYFFTGETFSVFSQLILSLTLPKVKNNGQDEPIPPEPEENTHFTCKFCGDTYGEDRFLQEHIKSVHEKRQQYECTLCDAILLGKDIFFSSLH